MATTPLTSSSSKGSVNPLTSSGKIEVFKYVGKLAGLAYSIGLYLKAPISLSSGSFEAKGTFDGLAVNAIVVPTTTGSSKAGSIQGTFHGSIGQWKVSGTISGPTGNTDRKTARATYTVTR
ncbi:MAG: hypothetical protein ABSF33_18280 [Acidimicrobiales bacterium]